MNRITTPIPHDATPEVIEFLMDLAVAEIDAFCEEKDWEGAARMCHHFLKLQERLKEIQG